MMDSYVCIDCGIEKPESEYSYTRNRSGSMTRRKPCRPCMVVRANAWKEANPEKHKERMKRTDLMKSYGLTLEEYNARLDACGWSCEICCRTLKFEGARTETPNVDHDHDTGVVRGMLCMNCNVALGSFMDSQEILRNAISYLDRFAEKPSPDEWDWDVV